VIIRRPLAALFALFYLLLAAGGEALQHGGSEPATAYAEAHVHAPGDSNGDWTPARAPSAGNEAAPALRSHAPPSSRAPPLG
jgi:hypothetical protein